MGDKYTKIQVRRIKDTTKDLDTNAYASIVPDYGEFVLSHTSAKDELVIGDGETVLPELPRLRLSYLDSVGKTAWVKGGVFYASDTDKLGCTVVGTTADNTIPLLRGNNSSAPSWIDATHLSTPSTIVGRGSSGEVYLTTIFSSTVRNSDGAFNLQADPTAGSKKGTLTLGNNGDYTGHLRIYSTGSVYSEIRSNNTQSGNNTFFLPNYAGTSYLVHTGNTDAYGGTTAPVYVASNGRISLCNTYAGGTKVTLNGTNLSSGDATFYAPTSGGTANYILKANGNGSAPTWIQTVPIANGGTGKTSWTQYGIVYASATTTLSQLGVGSSGQVLQSNGSATPSWVTPTNANTANTIVKRDGSGNFSAGTITANLTGTVTGNASTATKLATGRTLRVSLGSTSASTAFDGTANISDIGVSGTLAVGNGGTGKTSWTLYGIVYASDASTLTSLATGTSGYFLKSGGSSSAPSWVSPETVRGNIGAPKTNILTSAPTSSSPSSKNTGDLCFNKNTGILYIYNGSEWQAVVGVWG